MSDIFYKAIKAQEKLDDIFINKYWPAGATEPPPKRVSDAIYWRCQGFSYAQIAREMGISKDTVIGILRHT
jgi:DNA-binding NarL/FixJ family response regulator